MPKDNGAKKEYFQAPLSQKIVAQQGELLHSHTTPLIGYIEKSDRSTKLQQLGSGVLVSIGNIFGILTAQHVSNQIRNFEGLALPISQGIGRYLIPKDNLDLVEPVKPHSEEFGPDISFVKMSLHDAGIVKAHKVFCNLDIQADLREHHQPSLQEGIWYACGSPYEQATIQKGNAVFERIHTYKTYSFELKPEADFQKEGYDYIDAIYKYKEYQFPPLSFGGVSGGGIWQVLLGLDENGNAVTERRLLAGIMFYQSPMEEATRILRAHFRNSIYTLIYKLVETRFISL